VLADVRRHHLVDEDTAHDEGDDDARDEELACGGTREPVVLLLCREPGATQDDHVIRQ